MRQYSQWTILWEASIATVALIGIGKVILLALRGLGILLGGG